MQKYNYCVMPSKTKKRRFVRVFGRKQQIYTEDHIWHLVESYCKLNGINLSDFFRSLIIINFCKTYINDFKNKKNDRRN